MYVCVCVCVSVVLVTCASDLLMQDLFKQTDKANPDLDGPVRFLEHACFQEGHDA
jgi:hypothetical protein